MAFPKFGRQAKDAAPAAPEAPEPETEPEAEPELENSNTPKTRETVDSEWL